VTAKSVSSRFHQLAADDQLRANELQLMLDDDSTNAIFAVRGGYGTVGIMHAIDMSAFSVRTKWLIGFSDITVLHGHIYKSFGIPTIHGPMPSTIPQATPTSLETLRKALFGEEISYEYESLFATVDGTAEGVLIGGNLAILVSV